MKKKRFTTLCAILLVMILSTISCSTEKNNIDRSNRVNNKVENVQGNLIISTFSSSEKGQMLLYDLNDNSETILINDSNVAVSGDISSDGDSIYFANALTDDDPWQIYLHKTGEEEDTKLTDDEDGKASPRVLNKDEIYYLTGDDSGITRIGKFNSKTNSISLIDDGKSDCLTDAMDVYKDNIVMSSTSNNLYLKSWEENDGEDKPIIHSIYEMNKDGENLRKVVDFNASTVSSLSYTPDGKNLIMCGCDVNGNVGDGIFKVSLESGKIELLLNKDTFTSSSKDIICTFSNPSIAKMSLDESLIYFTGIETDSAEIEVAGIECNPAVIFSFNVNTKEIKKVYEPKEPGFIFDLNIKY